MPAMKAVSTMATMMPILMSVSRDASPVNCRPRRVGPEGEIVRGMYMVLCRASGE